MYFGIIKQTLISQWSFTEARIDGLGT